MKQSLPISLLIIAAFCSLFCSCTSEGERQHMAQIIAEADSLNRNYIPLTSDSLLLEACQYYDRFGSPNERMKAHYLLGCVYRDLGEAPRAIESYQDAVACADTTSTACDHYTLCRVHGQASWILYGQQLPNEMLEELTLYEKHAILAKDTLTAIDAFSRRADAYDLLAMDDSVIAIHERTYDRYMAVGNPSLAVMDVCAMVSALIDKGQLEKAAKYLSEYETLSGLFDENGNIDEQYNIYYYIKGKYHLAVSQLDSAEHMFRKALALSQNPNETEGGYQGLFQLYKRKHNPDSVSKYAELAYITSDSVYKDDNIERLQKIQAQYNYNIHRQNAIQQIAKVKQTRLFLCLVTLLLILAIGIAYHIINVQKKKKKAELEKMDIEHRHVIELMRQEQDDLLSLQEQRYQELSEEKNTSIYDLQQKLEKYSDLRQHYSPETLEERLHSSSVFKKLKEKVLHPGSVEITNDDWVELRNLFNEELPRFFGIVNSHKQLNATEYNMCMLIRLGFQPKELLILLDMQPGYNITMYRSRLLKKAFNIDESAKELDRLILNIK